MSVGGPGRHAAVRTAVATRLPDYRTDSTKYRSDAVPVESQV